MSLLLAMSCVVLSWLALGAGLSGVGLLAQRAAGVRGIGAVRLVMAFWMGYALTAGFLQLWSLAWPITWHAEALVLLAGAAGLAISRRELAAWASAVARRRRLGAIAILLAGLWIANQAIGPGTAFDSGMYHFQVIEWANAHAAVPGLANLWFAYGWSPAHLLFAAMLDTGPWDGRAEHLANGLLLWALAAQALQSLGRLARRGAAPSSGDVYGAALLPPAAAFVFSADACSPTTDVAATAIVLVIGWMLLRFVSRPGAGSHEFIVLATLCAAAACVKLSTAFFAAAAWAIALAIWWVRQREAPRRRAAAIAWALALGAALSGPWAARNVIQTGYPLYPLTSVKAPVPWRVPDAELRAIAKFSVQQGRSENVLSLVEELRGTKLDWYARLMEPPYKSWREVRGWSWLRPWLLSLPFLGFNEVLVPEAILAGCLVVLAARRRLSWRRGRSNRPRSGQSECAAGGRYGALETVLALAPALVGLAAWFIMKPAPRFATGMTWSAAAIAAGMVLQPALQRGSRRAALAVAAATVALSIVAVAAGAASIVAREGRILSRIPFRAPGPDRGFWPLPEQGYERRTTRRGLDVNVPSDGKGQCWRGPLPCTPVANPDLRPRRHADTGSGFEIDTIGLGRYLDE